MTTFFSKIVCIFRNDYENFVRELSRHLVQESERVDTYMASTIQVRFFLKELIIIAASYINYI